MLNIDAVKSNKVIEITDSYSGETSKVSNFVDAQKFILNAINKGHDVYLSRKEVE